MWRLYHATKDGRLFNYPVHLSRQDDNVLDALRFFQVDAAWWSLRKAYEVIERDEFGQQSKVANPMCRFSDE
jgi:hypothetical protein